MKNKGFALNDKISLRQMQALLFLEIFGFGVTSLPRRVAEAAAQDGWIGVVVATLAAIMMVWVIADLGKRYAGVGTFYDFVGKLVSKPIGALICLFYVVRLLIWAAFNLRIFAEIVQVTLLPTTPFIVIFGTMLALCAYGASKGMEARGRMAEVLVLVALLPLIFVFGVSGREIDLTNLLPIMHASPGQLGKASFSAFFAFNGIDILLLMIPFLAHKKELKKRSIGVVATIGGFMIVITAATIARFGQDAVTSYIWPVLKMMDTVNLPGQVLDRQGALMMTFWIISAYAVVKAALFFSSMLLKDVVKRGTHFCYILACVPVIAILANIPNSLPQLYEFLDVYNHTFGVAAMVVIPLVLLAFAKLKKPKEAQDAQ